MIGTVEDAANLSFRTLYVEVYHINFNCLRTTAIDVSVHYMLRFILCLVAYDNRRLFVSVHYMLRFIKKKGNR